jgi:hypothetical protein
VYWKSDYISCTLCSEFYSGHLFSKMFRISQCGLHTTWNKWTHTITLLYTCDLKKIPEFLTIRNGGSKNSQAKSTTSFFEPSYKQGVMYAKYKAYLADSLAVGVPIRTTSIILLCREFVERHEWCENFVTSHLVHGKNVMHLTWHRWTLVWLEIFPNGSW